ncbi:hypothetical protein [Streptomyces zingiberis]|uniref:Large membrane protein n=1 Tax=Streptomyces zingiberis TaxID=2053010 RepID=A0ABX1BPW0_9ACTN|nr:hypothetical protein [Streptomyces zingiberis]NJP99761.1 hypothetical protein [Streptomyces zingiberis]
MTTERSPEDTPEPDAPGTARRRRSVLVAASVAAAVLAAGGGGAYWASTAGGGGSGPAADPPPLRLDGWSGAETGADVAPGEPGPVPGAEYAAAGDLPDGPDSAPVYRPRGEVPRAAAERLARALDVDGKARLAGDTWQFGPRKDPSGPRLDVARQAAGTWTFHAYGPGGGCGGTGEPSPGGGTSGAEKAPDGTTSSAPSCSSSAGDPPEKGAGKTEDGPGDPLSAAAAEKAAAPVLKALGLAGAALDSSATTGAVRTVNAAPVLDGHPTYGFHTALRIGPDGAVVDGSGHLAELRKGAEYPLLGAGEALKRLNAAGDAGRSGSGGGDCASAVPHRDGDGPAAPPCAGPGAPETLPAPERGAAGREPGAAPEGDPGETEPTGQSEQTEQQGKQGKRTEPGDGPAGEGAERSRVTVREAEFGYAAQFVDGAQALVPSWLFRVEPAGAGDPYTVSHPAVRPEFVAGDAPGSRPSAPGDRPTSGPAEPAEPGEPGGDTSLTQVTSYEADGRTLTVRFWGGVCTDYTVTAEPRGERVEVRIEGTEKEPGRMCVKKAERMTEKVTLDEPLGDRAVVDARSGDRVPEGK